MYETIASAISDGSRPAIRQQLEVGPGLRRSLYGLMQTTQDVLSVVTVYRVQRFHNRKAVSATK